MDLILATTNEGKKREYEALLQPLGFHLYTLKDYPDLAPAEETGQTFLENARLKADAIFKATGIAALADDSGLAVDALDGAPGIYSARYAGEEHNDALNNQKLLLALKDVPDEKRTAHFCCAIALRLNETTCLETEGKVHGFIAHQLQGEGGFGYDPLFLLDDGKSMAEISLAEKNRISHRAVAGERLITLLQKEGLL